MWGVISVKRESFHLGSQLGSQLGSHLDSITCQNSHRDYTKLAAGTTEVDIDPPTLRVREGRVGPSTIREA